MKGEEITLWVLAGIGVLSLAWMAQQQTQGSKAPKVQSDEDVLGIGAQGSVMSKPGMPLDVRVDLHGWHPGYDPNPHAVPVRQPRVRYPAVPGGNLSTVMHKGWSSCVNDAPFNNIWFNVPPEASVL